MLRPGSQKPHRRQRKLVIVTAQLNLNLSWSDYIMGWTTHPPPMKLQVVVVQLLRHLQATQEAHFRYATLF